MMEGTKEADLAAQLGLQPHPEGGFFVETFRSPMRVTLPDGRIRSASTAIYFLLPSGTFSALHRVSADEVWHYYDGAPLELTTITPQGVLHKVTLGRNLFLGHTPQYVVPAGVWQGGHPLKSEESGYTLVGCTVAPGFDFEDFEMPERAVIVRLFPQHAAVIQKLTRS